MANIVYGLPFTPTPTPGPDWQGMLMTWTGWDGSVWTLSDRDSGALLLAGTRGLTLPPSRRVVDTSPAVAGSLHRGSVTDEREVFWPIKIFHGDGALAWVARDRAFRRTLDPDRPGVWAVTQPSGETRRLTCYFDNEGGQAFDTLPSLTGWARYGLTLVAEQPYWVGEPMVNSFKAPDPPEPFFEPNGPQIINIVSSYSAENATMDNPGDVESYPRWYIDGETIVVGDEPSASVGVGDLIVSVPFAIPAGQCLVIESDPVNIGATLYDIAPSGADMKPSDRVIGVDLINPADRTADLGEADFGAIPPGASVPLSLTVSGTGKVECYLPTLWRAAW